jgi:hypothetical protein
MRYPALRAGLLSQSCPILADEQPSELRNLLNALKRTRANGTGLVAVVRPSASTTAKVEVDNRVKQRGPHTYQKTIWTSKTLSRPCGTKSLIGSDFFGGFRDDRCRGLETDLGMGSVAEWLVGRCSAATERDGGFTGKIY